jgi:hypothetical protein
VYGIRGHHELKNPGYRRVSRGLILAVPFKGGTFGSIHIGIGQTCFKTFTEIFFFGQVFRAEFAFGLMAKFTASFIIRHD